MQKVVGSNPISRFALQSQIRRRPSFRSGPVVAQTPNCRSRRTAVAMVAVTIPPSVEDDPLITLGIICIIFAAIFGTCVILAVGDIVARVQVGAIVLDIGRAWPRSGRVERHYLTYEDGEG